MFRYQIDEDISLELQSYDHAETLFPLVDAHRDFIGAYLPWPHKTYNIDDMRDYLQRDLRGMTIGRRWGWMILYRGQAVGRCGIFITVPQLRECEIHYWLAENFTGKGIITRVARAIIDFAFHELQLKHVLIAFSGGNDKSGAVAQRLGFQHEITKRDADNAGEAWSDLHFWGVMADEWKSQHQPTFSYPVDEQIHLRLQQLHYAEAQYQLIQNNLDDLKPWFRWAENYTLEREHAYTEKLLQTYADGNGMMLGIWEEEQLLGSIGLEIDRANRSAEIGYWLDKAAQGKGIMTRSIKALMHYIFDIQRLGRFNILAASQNKASRAIAERLGMKQEAILQKAEFVNGRYNDLVVYSLLKDEWNGL